MGLCIGLDAHLRLCVYQVKDDSGNVVEKDSIPSKREALLELARKYPTATVILECSSVHEWIYDLLTTEGMHVVACHPQNIYRALGKKNDETDAGFLVDAYRLNALPRSYVAPQEIRRLRRMVRHRAFLTRERTRFKNRAHSIFKRRGIKLIDPTTNEETTEVFLKRLRAQVEQIDDFELPVLLDIVDAFSKRIDAAERRFSHEILTNEDAQNLATIPGFGSFTAFAILAEIGDVSRFRNADALASYFGLVPSEMQSGDSHVRGHITRRGSSLARWLLTQAAWTHVNTCPKSSLTKSYRKLSKKVGKQRAIIAVARKLVKISYWLLKEKRSFTLTG